MARYGQCRIRHAWANDSDMDSCNTFRKNIDIPSNMVLCRDVAKLDFDRLPAIDGLVFGFPCNDFSIVGDRKGSNGEYGGLYKWGVRALRHFQPLFFVAENVGGLQSGEMGKTFKVILNALKESGYRVRHDLYRFEELGVPQTRRRIIIVGFREDLDVEFTPPVRTSKTITCREAIESPPIAKNGNNHELTVQHPRVVERLKHIKQGENAFTAAMPERLRLKMASGATISQIYRRLDPDKPAYTVTGSGGGGTHIYHWYEHRALTNRERARLQSFPDDFVFCGSKESVRRQIGMAVPPKAGTAIFHQVLKILTKRENHQ